MREMMIREERKAGEENRKSKYIYSILIDVLSGDVPDCESYGVRVTAPASGQVVDVPHVTASADRIYELMDLLIRHQVSPILLRDVIDDWL